jgi:hypothetical protein
MNTLVLEHECLIQEVQFTEDSFVVHLNDGRTISVPLTWYLTSGFPRPNPLPMPKHG